MSNSEKLSELSKEQRDYLNNNGKFYVDSGGMFGLKVGSIQHTIYDVPDQNYYDNDEIAFLHSHGVDYGDIDAEGRVAQLVLT